MLSARPSFSLSLNVLNFWRAGGHNARPKNSSALTLENADPQGTSSSISVATPSSHRKKSKISAHIFLLQLFRGLRKRTTLGNAVSAVGATEDQHDRSETDSSLFQLQPPDARRSPEANSVPSHTALCIDRELRPAVDDATMADSSIHKVVQSRDPDSPTGGINAAELEHPSTTSQIVPQSENRISRIHADTHRDLNVWNVAGGVSQTTNHLYLEGGIAADFDRDHHRLRELADKDPNIRRVLCVAVGFCNPPSVAQISDVLSWSSEQVSSEQVSSVLNSVARYLEVEVSRANVIVLPAAFGSKLSSIWGPELGRAHEWLACWCLGYESMTVIRDINYATRCWAYHVSQARPSSKITDALRKEPFPLRSITQEQISNVISWLKDEFPDQSDLIARYGELYARSALSR